MENKHIESLNKLLETALATLFILVQLNEFPQYKPITELEGCVVFQVYNSCAIQIQVP